MSLGYERRNATEMNWTYLHVNFKLLNILNIYFASSITVVCASFYSKLERKKPRRERTNQFSS